jgi:hypothetical protein
MVLGFVAILEKILMDENLQDISSIPDEHISAE